MIHNYSLLSFVKLDNNISESTSVNKLLKIVQGNALNHLPLNTNIPNEDFLSINKECKTIEEVIEYLLIQRTYYGFIYRSDEENLEIKNKCIEFFKEYYD